MSAELDPNQLTFFDGTTEQANSILRMAFETLEDANGRTGTGGICTLSSSQAGDLNAPTGLVTLTGLTAPISEQDATNKQYVDEVPWKKPARYGTTVSFTAGTASTDTTISGLRTVDGATVAEGDRILVMHHANKQLNGLWIASSGDWTRSYDLQAGWHASGVTITVIEGTQNATRTFVCKTAGPNDVVGTDALDFSTLSVDLPWKQSVRVATSAPLANPNPGDPAIQYQSNKFTNVKDDIVVDGVTPALNDRILVKNQVDARQNGVYLVLSGSGANLLEFMRAADLAEGSSARGATVTVEEGTQNQDSPFVCTSNKLGDSESIPLGDVVGDSNLVWESTSAKRTWKDPVQCATTAAIATISTATMTAIDGHSLSANDRILVKDQTTKSENGIYVATGSSPFTLTRAADLPAGFNAAGTQVLVEKGTVNADHTFLCTSDRGDPAKVAANDLEFVRTSALGQINIGRGLIGGFDASADASFQVGDGTTIQIKTHGVTGAAVDDVHGQAHLSMIAQNTITDFNIASGAGIAMSKIKDLESTLDNLRSGIHWKEPVRLASTSNIDVTAAAGVAIPGDTIDGVPIAAGDRVLLLGQSHGEHGGIYVVGGETGAWTFTRTVDFGGEDADFVHDDASHAFESATPKVHASSTVGTHTLSDGDRIKVTGTGGAHDGYYDVTQEAHATSFDVSVNASSQYVLDDGSGSPLTKPALELRVGQTYAFVQTNAGYDAHPLNFYGSSDKSQAIDNATTTVAVSSNATHTTTTVTVSQDDLTLYYQCGQPGHDAMGNSAHFSPLWTFTYSARQHVLNNKTNQAAVFVKEGDDNQDTAFVCEADAPKDVIDGVHNGDPNTIKFVQFGHVYSNEVQDGTYGRDLTHSGIEQIGQRQLQIKAEAIRGHAHRLQVTADAAGGDDVANHKGMIMQETITDYNISAAAIDRIDRTKIKGTLIKASELTGLGETDAAAARLHLPSTVVYNDEDDQTIAGALVLEPTAENASPGSTAIGDGNQDAALYVKGGVHVQDHLKVGQTFTVTSTSTLTGDATFGGNIVADGDEAKTIFAAVATSTKKITLGGGGTVKTAGDLEIAGGDIVATTIENAANVFATTTGLVTVGGGPVNLSAAGSQTTVDGSLAVTEAATLSSTLADATTPPSRATDVRAPGRHRRRRRRGPKTSSRPSSTGDHPPDRRHGQDRRERPRRHGRRHRRHDHRERRERLRHDHRDRFGGRAAIKEKLGAAALESTLETTVDGSLAVTEAATLSSTLSVATTSTLTRRDVRWPHRRRRRRGQKHLRGRHDRQDHPLDVTVKTAGDLRRARHHRHDHRERRERLRHDHRDRDGRRRPREPQRGGERNDGRRHPEGDRGGDAVESTLSDATRQQHTGDVTFGGHIVADADRGQKHLRGRHDGQDHPRGGGTVKTAGDLEIAGGDILHDHRERRERLRHDHRDRDGRRRPREPQRGGERNDGRRLAGGDRGGDAVWSTLSVASTSTLTGDVTFGGHIVADADEDKTIFAAVTTDKITLGGGGTVKTAGDLEISGGDIVATTIGNAANVFATTTGTVTVGGGPVNLSAAGSETTVDGTLKVTEAATLSTTLSVATDVDPHGRRDVRWPHRRRRRRGQKHLRGRHDGQDHPRGAAARSRPPATLNSRGRRDIVATTIGNAANVFATTTGTVSVGGGPVNLSAAGSETTVDGSLAVTEAATLSSTLSVATTSTLTGDVTFGRRHIVADADEANDIFAAVTTDKITLGRRRHGQDRRRPRDRGRRHRGHDHRDAANVFATTTGRAGHGGPVNLSAAEPKRRSTARWR